MMIALQRMVDLVAAAYRMIPVTCTAAEAMLQEGAPYQQAMDLAGYDELIAYVTLLEDNLIDWYLEHGDSQRPVVKDVREPERSQILAEIGDLCESKLTPPKYLNTAPQIRLG